MSLRPQADVSAPAPKSAISFVPPAAPSAETSAPAEESATGLKWSELTETEKSAASLGVDPTSFKPITFMNAYHHETLLKANMIDGELAKKLEAYKSVAAGMTPATTVA
jgi:hypothetical protein